MFIEPITLKLNKLGVATRRVCHTSWLRTRTSLGAVRDRIDAIVARWINPSVNSNRYSLVARLMTLLLLGACVIYVLSIAGMWWTANWLFQDHARKQAIQWIAQLDEFGTPLYVSKKPDQSMADITERIKHFPEIGFIRYYDASGTVVLGKYFRIEEPGLAPITEAQKDRLKPLLSGNDPYVFDTVARSRTYLRALAPIRIRSTRSDGMFGFRLDDTTSQSVKIIGLLEIGIDLTYYRSRLTGAIGVGGIVTAGMFLLFFVIGRFLIRQALAPLSQLQVPLARLAEGDTDVYVDGRGDKEIVAITNALNVTINAIKERDETLRRLADHDPLTGLVNRACFSRELDREWQRSSRGGATSAVLYIDLDLFKYVNDALGHAAGDRVLVQVSEYLRGRLRDDDVLARLGGDEFAILARNAGKQGAIELARSINRMMQDFHFIEAGQVFNIYCSIGIAMLDPSRFTMEEILSQADMACYQAKSSGRNCYAVHEVAEHVKEKMVSDMGWSKWIREAIRDNRFKLVYEPIVPLNSKHSGEMYEALLRMEGRDGKLIAPAVFLPVAERFGLLVQIDYWVIRNALKALAGHRASGRDITLAINLSGQAFEDGDSLVEVIKENLKKHKVPGSAVVFEMTEQVAVRHMNTAREAMRHLGKLGCRFSLDDFGAGFSSFGYLKHLSVAFIKIDGFFIEEMIKDPVDQTMVQAMVQVAKALGKQTVAEYVQNEETIALLAKYGVDYIQGFYFGGPSNGLQPDLFRPASAKPQKARARTG